MERCASQHRLWWALIDNRLKILLTGLIRSGLGFASEAELGKFIEKFHEVKEATKNAMAKASTNGSSAVTPVTSANASPVTSRSSITQNDSFVSDIADPPLSATGSIVSNFLSNELILYHELCTRRRRVLSTHPSPTTITQLWTITRRCRAIHQPKAWPVPSSSWSMKMKD